MSPFCSTAHREHPLGLLPSEFTLGARAPTSLPAEILSLKCRVRSGGGGWIYFPSVSARKGTDGSLGEGAGSSLRPGPAVQLVHPEPEVLSDLVRDYPPGPASVFDPLAGAPPPRGKWGCPGPLTSTAQVPEHAASVDLGRGPLTSHVPPESSRE